MEGRVMPVLTIGNKRVSIGDDFLGLSPDQQNAAVEQIADHLGTTTGNASLPSPTPDIGEYRESLVAALRGIPIGGAYADKATAMLNAAAQPFLETGLSHAPTYAER